MARLLDSQNPVFDSRFLDFSFGDDFETLQPGELVNRPLGVRALSGNDHVHGSSSPEIVNGNQGNDTLFGAGGNDYLRGGQDQDLIYGEDGEDLLNGNFGNDTVLGGNGGDTVRGGQGDDDLFGDSGNDFLIGDLGADNMTGGSGADSFVFRSDDTTFDISRADVVLDFNVFEGDRIALQSNVNFFLDDSTDLSNIFFAGTSAPDTVIRLNDSNGAILGVVLDINRFDLLPTIGIVSDILLNQG